MGGFVNPFGDSVSGDAGVKKWVTPEVKPAEIKSPEAKPSETKLEEVVDSKQQEEPTLLEQLRLAMIEAKGDREHTDIGLSDIYWSALDAYKLEYNRTQQS